MWGSEILDIAIGVVFVYILMSLAASAAGEIFAHLTSMRFRNLKKGISGMVGGTLGGQLLKHPLIKSLGKKEKPSHVPGYLFVSALLDLVDSDKESSPTKEIDLVKVIGNLVGKDITERAAKVEAWFDDVMEQVSDWYKKKLQIILLIFGLAISALLNVDTIALVNRFSVDDAIRTEVVAVVEEIAEKGSLTEEERSVLRSDGLEFLGEAGFFGWSDRVPKGFLGWLTKVIGILLTGLAISLGAPFWFDLGNRLVGLRPSEKKRAAAAGDKSD